MMEDKLQGDLADVLEGIDPMELLLQDPNLAEVAEEMCDLLNNDDKQPVALSDVPSHSSLESAMSSPEHSTESSDNSNSSFELATYTKAASNKSKPKASCEVCGRLADHYLNYGAVTCNSCRAFFSRSSKDNAYENFVCVNKDSISNKMCKIDSASWKSCKKCRYKRCQQLGMKLKGRSAHEVAGGASPYLVGEHLSLALTLTDKLTNDERIFIRSIITKRLDCKTENRSKFLLRDPKHFRVRHNQTFHGQAITLKDFKLFEDFVVYGQLETFSEGEFSADGLTKKDRVRLLSKNFPLAIEFFEAYRIEMERWKQYDPVKDLEYVLRSLSLEDKEQYYAIHKEVTKDGKLQPKKVVYGATYEGMNFELEEQAQRHKRIVSRIISLSLNEPDPVLPMLIVSLIIYSPDSVDLDHPESAERVQLKFASLLHRYLKCKRTPRREAIFRECMMVPFYGRELRAFREAAYKKKLGKQKR